jgi:prepilin-type N-terminal cleavage/methylation domain-containing protein
MSRARSRTPRGFTLFELLVVLIVASLIAGTGYALLAPWAQERKLRAGTERLAAALEFGRDVARLEGRAVRVRVAAAGTSGGNSVHVIYAESGADVVHPLTKAAFVLDFAGDPPLRGVEITASAAGGDDTVDFDAQGQVVDDDTRFTLECGGMQSHVRVERYSGRVVIDAPGDATDEAPVPVEPPRAP